MNLNIMQIQRPNQSKQEDSHPKKLVQDELLSFQHEKLDGKAKRKHPSLPYKYKIANVLDPVQEITVDHNTNTLFYVTKEFYFKIKLETIRELIMKEKQDHTQNEELKDESQVEKQGSFYKRVLDKDGYYIFELDMEQVTKIVKEQEATSSTQSEFAFTKKPRDNSAGEKIKFMKSIEVHGKSLLVMVSVQECQNEEKMNDSTPLKFRILDQNFDVEFTHEIQMALNELKDQETTIGDILLIQRGDELEDKYKKMRTDKEAGTKFSPKAVTAPIKSMIFSQVRQMTNQATDQSSSSMFYEEKMFVFIDMEYRHEILVLSKKDKKINVWFKQSADVQNQEDQFTKVCLQNRKEALQNQSQNKNRIDDYKHQIAKQFGDTTHQYLYFQRHVTDGPTLTEVWNISNLLMQDISQKQDEKYPYRHYLEGQFSSFIRCKESNSKKPPFFAAVSLDKQQPKIIHCKINKVNDKYKQSLKITKEEKIKLMAKEEPLDSLILHNTILIFTNKKKVKAIDPQTLQELDSKSRSLDRYLKSTSYTAQQPFQFFEKSLDGRLLLGTQKHTKSQQPTKFSVFTDRFEWILKEDNSYKDFELNSNFLTMRTEEQGGTCVIVDLDEGEQTTFHPYMQLQKQAVIQKNENNQCDYILAHEQAGKIQVIGIKIKVDDEGQDIVCMDMEDNQEIFTYRDQRQFKTSQNTNQFQLLDNHLIWVSSDETKQSWWQSELKDVIIFIRDLNLPKNDYSVKQYKLFPDKFEQGDGVITGIKLVDLDSALAYTERKTIYHIQFKKSNQSQQDTCIDNTELDNSVFPMVVKVKGTQDVKYLFSEGFYFASKDEAGVLKTIETKQNDRLLNNKNKSQTIDKFRNQKPIKMVKHCLVEENFQTIVLEEIAGVYKIQYLDVESFDVQTKYTQNGEEKDIGLREKGKMVWISDELFAIERKVADSYAVYKKQTGWLCAVIQNVDLVESRCRLVREVRQEGTNSKIICFICKRTSKCYEPTLDSIFQIGVTINDLKKRDITGVQKAFQKIRIIGDIAPACFANKLNDFYRERPDNKIQSRVAKDKSIQKQMIKKYIARYMLKVIRAKKDSQEVQTIYENILHLICKNDNLIGLKYYNKHAKELNGNFFINCPYSPIIFLKLRTGIETMKKLQKSSINQRIAFFDSFKFFELNNMINLNSQAIEHLFNAMSIDLEYYDNFNPFKSVQMGILVANPYREMEQIKDLKKKLINTNLHEEIRKDLLEVSDSNTKNKSTLKNLVLKIVNYFTNSQQSMQPVVFKIILMPFNFYPGSLESIQFLRVLRDKGVCPLYLADSAQALVEHKFKKVRKFGLIKLVVYCLYLLLLNTYNEMWTIELFFAYFTFLEIIKMKGNKEYLKEVTFFWSMVDVSRIFLLCSYIIARLMQQEKANFIIYFLLTIHSWIGLLDTLRIFENYQFMLTLITKALSETVQYMISLIVMYNSFALGYYYMVNGRERFPDHWSENLMNAYLLQFNILFGSFDSFGISYRMKSTYEMILFMITALLMPLLMLNILIALLGHAFIDIKEKWENNNKYYQKVRIIYEIELLMIWNLNKTSDKAKTNLKYLMHGSYAKVQSECKTVKDFDKQMSGRYKKQKDQSSVIHSSIRSNFREMAMEIKHDLYEGQNKVKDKLNILQEKVTFTDETSKN